MINNSLLLTLGYCLGVTIILEVILALVIGIRDKKDLLNVVLVQVLTNPLLVSIQLYLRFSYGTRIEHIAIYPMEIIVVIIEGFVYSKVLKYKKINPYLVSFILNGGSYSIGILLNYLF